MENVEFLLYEWELLYEQGAPTPPGVGRRLGTVMTTPERAPPLATADRFLAGRGFFGFSRGAGRDRSQRAAGGTVSQNFAFRI